MPRVEILVLFLLEGLSSRDLRAPHKLNQCAVSGDTGRTPFKVTLLLEDALHAIALENTLFLLKKQITEWPYLQNTFVL